MISRIRTVKPEFYRHEGLFDAEMESGLPLRLAFSGLFTCCDREGRFQWRPRTLKTAILPYDDLDFSKVLDTLASHRFIIRYSVGDEDYGYIPTFKKHQVINNRERESELPGPPDRGEDAAIITPKSDASVTRESREVDAQSTPRSAVPDAMPEPLCSAQAEREREREGNKDQKEKDTKAPAGANFPRPEEFGNAWNRTCGPLSKIREFTESRKRKVTRRIMQGLTLEQFETAVRTCASTPFLSGDNQRGWKADFDWLVENDTNIAKVMEGKYQGNAKPVGGVLLRSEGIKNSSGEPTMSETEARQTFLKIERKKFEAWQASCARYGPDWKVKNPWRGPTDWSELERVSGLQVA